MSAARGRPKVDNPKSERLFIRVSKGEKEEIQAFLKETNISMLELIRLGMQSAKK